jgi:hypothetical protein
MQGYEKPTIEDFGAITDLTQAGLTRAGPDAKEGSVNGGLPAE